MLQLLLNLSESPTNVKIQVQEQIEKISDEKPIEDWSKFLLEGEVLTEDVYEDESPLSSDLENEAPPAASLYKSVDSGIVESPDRIKLLPLEDVEDDLVSGRRWLMQKLITPYWTLTEVNSEVKNHRLVANLAREWEKYLDSNGVILNRGATCVLSEAIILRETIWLLLGIPYLFIFTFKEGHFSVREDVQVSHLTEGCLYQFLQSLTIYGNMSVKLRNFIKEMVTLKVQDPTSNSDVKAEASSCPSMPCQTYQAFAANLHVFFQQFDVVLIEMETLVKKAETTFTLSMFLNKLTPRFDELILLNSIYERGIASCSATENWHKAAQLLNALYNTLIELDTLSMPNEDLIGFLIPFWLETCCPYMEMIDGWLAFGHLQDPYQEFIIQRNTYVQLKDEKFWDSAFTIYCLSSSKLPEESTTTDGDEGKQSGMMKFLQPVLKQIVQAGKSMEILQSLDLLKELIDQQRADSSLYHEFVKKIIRLLGGDVADFKNTNTICNVEKSTGLCTVDENFHRHIQIKGTKDALLDVNFGAIFNAQKNYLPIDDKNERFPRRVFVTDLVPLQLAMQEALYPLIEQKCLRVCSKLMDILKKDFKIMECLAAMRKFYLMEAGDMMFQFYSEVFEKLRAGEAWHEASFLNTVLAEAGAQYYSEELDRLSVSVDSTSKGRSLCDSNALDSICLNYKVLWPADLVLNSYSQQIYNQVFRFLLQIKRAKYSLDELRFADLERCILTDSSSDINMDLSLFSWSRNEKIHRMQLFRMRLMHFINSLHNHLMTRILHSTCLTFETELEHAQDLEQLLSLHSAYLNQIHERCLLHGKVFFIRNSITTILNLALTFHTKWDSGVDNISSKQLEDMETEFLHCYQFLTTFLKNIVKRGAFPHLESLGISLMSSAGVQPLFK